MLYDNPDVNGEMATGYTAKLVVLRDLRVRGCYQWCCCDFGLLILHASWLPQPGCGVNLMEKNDTKDWIDFKGSNKIQVCNLRT